jgi:hypothetical protein
MMSYNVGQILFVVLHKKNQVYPMQVIEEITKKTLKGEVKTYVLQGGSDPNSTVVLDQIDGEVFDSSEEVRQTLLSRATNQINKIVATAVTKSKEWYSSSNVLVDNVIDNLQTSDLPQPEEPQELTVTLPDGTKARLKSN